MGGTARSALYVASEDVAALQGRIGQLVVDAQLRLVLLLDSGGDVVCSGGDAVGYDVPALGALLAGHFAASRELARLLHERGFRVSVQQGQQAHLLTALVGERWLVAAVFDGAGNLGVARLMVARAADDLAEALARVARRRPELPSADFVERARQQIDRVFQEDSGTGA